jgi:CMP-N,N'-diacetyllegionaminic acid synthase
MILGIIPARGGSKSIPRKNIKLLAGKPLVVWTIESALESRRLDEFIVSTDDDEIAGICVSAGATVVMRPPELATDDSTTLDVIRHHMGNADVVVLLQPTSPIRGERSIDKAITCFEKEQCDTLATGYMSTHYGWGVKPHGPRQKKEAFFKDTGSIFIFKREVIESNRWIGDKPYQMITPPMYNLDIDDESDFWAAEGIIAHRDRL